MCLISETEKQQSGGKKEQKTEEMREGWRRNKSAGFCRSVCFLARVHLIEQASPSDTATTHLSPSHAHRGGRCTVQLQSGFSASVRHGRLTDVGRKLHMCHELSVAAVICQTETAEGDCGWNSEHLGRQGTHIQKGLLWVTDA